MSDSGFVASFTGQPPPRGPIPHRPLTASRRAAVDAAQQALSAALFWLCNRERCHRRATDSGTMIAISRPGSSCSRQ
jgi:hypothetical protein